MGSFFLCRRDSIADRGAVCRQMAAMAFSAPTRRQFGEIEIFLWRRLRDARLDLLDEPESGDFAVSVGTLVYRESFGESALRQVLGDLKGRNLDWDELTGSFAVVLSMHGQVLILNDWLQVQPVFVDRDKQWASTSLLAMAAARPGPLHLDRHAAVEKFCTGYIVGPDTILQDVQKATATYQQNWDPSSWHFVCPPSRSGGSSYGWDSRLSRRDAIQLQTDTITSYFRSIRPLCEAEGATLGLSAGYDSRMLFAHALKEISQLTVQTHWTRGVPGHEIDRKIVQRWADERKVPCIISPTEPTSALGGEALDALAEDCLLFFDGRNSHNMGILSQVYTRTYSLATLGAAGLRLNGLGGELYRNYYFTARREVQFEEWLRRHVLYPTADESVRDGTLLRQANASKIAKMEVMLGTALRGRVPWQVLRRYYSEVRMPECDGVNANAHNQVARYLMPFIEWRTIRAGYGAGPHIGFSGRFQAELIAEADPALAGGPSHYGFPLNRESLTHRAKAFVKGYLPDRAALSMMRLRRRRSDATISCKAAFDLLITKSVVLRESVEALQAHLPELDVSVSLQNPAHGYNALFLGSLFRHLGSRLR